MLSMLLCLYTLTKSIRFYTKAEVLFVEIGRGLKQTLLDDPTKTKSGNELHIYNTE
jgi:hypothetical protein